MFPDSAAPVLIPRQPSGHRAGRGPGRVPVQPSAVPTPAPVPAPSAAVSRHPWGLQPLAERLFQTLLDQKGSDLHCSSFEVPIARIHGDMEELTEFGILGPNQILEMMEALAPPLAWARFQEKQRRRFRLCLRSRQLPPAGELLPGPGGPRARLPRDPQPDPRSGQAGPRRIPSGAWRTSPRAWCW